MPASKPVGGLSHCWVHNNWSQVLTLKGSDGVKHSELVRFWILSTVRCSKNYYNWMYLLSLI
jgi:hypothetical protein